MDPIRVLIVDDHAILRAGLRALLDLSEDINVVGEAGDGMQAIAQIRYTRPDVVILDMAMPGMGGLEATRRILKENPNVRVLILSQHDDERYVIPVIQEGASGYVLKRAVSDELEEAIRVVNSGGSYLPPEIADAVLRVFRSATRKTNQNSAPVLTEREREILTLVVEGYSSTQIAERLHISIKTVMSHRANIYKKLGTHNRLELIKHATEMGLVYLGTDLSANSTTE